MLRDQLVPGNIAVTKRERFAKLFSRIWTQDCSVGVYGPTYIDLEPRSLCMVISNNVMYPHGWYCVLANGVIGWLNYNDIAHVEPT